MAVDAIDLTLTELDEWAVSRGVDVNRDDMRLLLELSREHPAHEAPAGLEPGDVDELLLDIYPDEVLLETVQDAQDVIRVIATLLTFLGETKRLPADEIAELDRELDEAGPEFIKAIAESEGGNG